MGTVPEGRRPSERAVGLADRLHSASIHLLRRLRREDGAAGLSGPQLSALAVIVYGGPLRLGELAEAEQVRPPTITRLVRQMEEAGLVERGPDPEDGRVVRVRATADGVRLLQEGRRRRVATLAEQLERAAPREMDALEEAAAVLERLLRG